MLDEFRKVVPGAIRLTFLEEFLRPGDSLWVNPATGFLTSTRTMTASEVASYWSEVIFPEVSEDSYSANKPFARARLLYVIESIVQTLRLDKHRAISWCDFATGEGVMLELLSTLYPGFRLSATEHSKILVSGLQSRGFDVRELGLGLGGVLDLSSENDVSTLTWTLANSIDPVSLLHDVVQSTKEGGFVCVAESSRILVPTRKSLINYLSKTDPADSHPSHFSANTLRCIMELVGLEICYTNRFFDSDVLLVIGRKVTRNSFSGFSDPQELVVSFMQNWYDQTRFYETLRLS